jgi:hypothetical protein
VGTSVAAVLIAKERHIVRAFQRAGATTPATAVTPASIGVAEHLAFRKLRNRAILREAGGNTFYLDEMSWQAARAVRRRLVLIALVIVLIGGVLLWRATG